MYTDNNKPSPEIKSAEISEVFGEFMHAFEMFKDANDQRLSEIERRFGSDGLTQEKVDRISRVLDEQKNTLDSLMLKQLRPQLGKAAFNRDDHKKAFETYIRTGEKTEIFSLSKKNMSSKDPETGGYVTPESFEKAINTSLNLLSPMRSLASVKKISSSGLKKVFFPGMSVTGWVEETKEREKTDVPHLDQINFLTYELYAMPAITQVLLDDAFLNIEEWIIGEVDKAFAEQENKAFTIGSKNEGKTPIGFTSYPDRAEGKNIFDKLEHLPAALDDYKDTKKLPDKLIDLVYSLNDGYRQNATWVMNRKTQALLRKMKDPQGHYLWQPPASLGQKASLMGFPVVEIEHMPDETGTEKKSTPIAFGDFARGYLIVDRAGIQVLRDPYSEKPNVLFYITKRVGGGVQDFEAIKLLRVEKSG